jgi:hypothetical protein
MTKVDDSFIFPRGKYEGKSYGLVKKMNPQYIEWCHENSPNIFKVKKKPEAPKEPAARKEPPSDEDAPPSKYLTENTNFLNEGPHGKLD